jgi:hypothetical protein
MYRGLAITGHDGADAGYRADFLRFPGEQLSIGCLCNLGSLNPRNFTKQVAEVYLGAKMALEPKPVVPQPVRRCQRARSACSTIATSARCAGWCVAMES